MPGTLPGISFTTLLDPITSGAISTTSLREANLLFISLGFCRYLNFPGLSAVLAAELLAELSAGALEHGGDGNFLPQFLRLPFLQCLVLLFEHHEGFVGISMGLQGAST